MALPVGFYGADRRRQRLAQHLAAEHTLGARFGTEAAKDVLLDLLEIEQAAATSASAALPASCIMKNDPASPPSPIRHANSLCPSWK